VSECATEIAAGVKGRGRAEPSEPNAITYSQAQSLHCGKRRKTPKIWYTTHYLLMEYIVPIQLQFFKVHFQGYIPLYGVLRKFSFKKYS